MTEKRTDLWERYNPPSYRQQKIVNPRSENTPNNARFPVWHFSRLYTLRKFENPPRWGDDGRGRRGEPTLYPFLCNVQPINSTERQYELEQIPQADRTKAMIYVTYDPFITNENNPQFDGLQADLTKPMYQNGIFIRLGDQRTIVGDAAGNTGVTTDLEINHAHADVLQYDGLLWQALWTDLHNGGDEDKFSYVGRIGHAIMGMFEDYSHERHSSMTSREVFDGVIT